MYFRWLNQYSVSSFMWCWISMLWWFPCASGEPWARLAILILHKCLQCPSQKINSMVLNVLKLRWTKGGICMIQLSWPRSWCHVSPVCAPLDCLLPPQDLLTLRGLLAAVPEIVEVDLQHPAEHPKNLISKIKEIDKVTYCIIWACLSQFMSRPLLTSCHGAPL